ncbi:MAG: ion channel, partial [candidate division WOR-3 bacterium]
MLCFGIVGYMIIEGWGFLDSLYQTVITISAVGFEVYPL